LELAVRSLKNFLMVNAILLVTPLLPTFAGNLKGKTRFAIKDAFNPIFVFRETNQIDKHQNSLVQDKRGLPQIKSVDSSSQKIRTTFNNIIVKYLKITRSVL
jgi:hypothetical protein